MSLSYSVFVANPGNEQAMDYLNHIFDEFQHAYWTTFAAGVVGIFPNDRYIRQRTMQILSSAGLIRKPRRNAYTYIYNNKFPRPKTGQSVWMITHRGVEWVHKHRERHQRGTPPEEVRV